MDMEVNERIRAYYTRLYFEEVGLRDWEQRVENRLNEEVKYCSRYIDYLASWFPSCIPEKDILIVGAGTGGEMVNFSKLGARVTAIEPNEEAYEICKLKQRLYHLNNTLIKNGALSEDLFRSDLFDLVYCQTVIEHVDDVENLIQQMIRVVKPNGLVFIGAPDYRQFWEPHYKLPLPMFLPKSLVWIMLKILGRPTEFLGTLKFVNSRRFANSFMGKGVTAFRVILPWPKRWIKNPVWHERLVMKITRLFEIHRDQIWILKKTGDR